VIDRIASAVAKKVHGVALEPDRVGLNEAAQSGMIDPGPVIIQAQRVQIFPAGKQKSVSVSADRPWLPVPPRDGGPEEGSELNIVTKIPVTATENVKTDADASGCKYFQLPDCLRV